MNKINLVFLSEELFAIFNDRFQPIHMVKTRYDLVNSSLPYIKQVSLRNQCLCEKNIIIFVILHICSISPT